MHIFGEGVFQGRLAGLALKFTSKWIPSCFGMRRRNMNGIKNYTASHAISVCRQAYQSPYDRTIWLIERLLRHSSISKFLYPILIDENIKNTGIYKDPTQPLQTLFERGYTLNILLNNLESPFVATIDLAASNQMDLFWRGCLDAGLVNAEAVTSYDRLELTLCTVARILDILEQRGLLGSVDPRYISPHSIYPQVLDHKSRAAELARTEAAYVHDLERLAGFLHHADVFYGHVQELATLHRAFSMRIQYMAAQPVSAQLFDTAFNGLEEAFEVYSRFCAELARSSVARSAADISALLMRPIQRLAQYPLLFQSIAAEMYSSYKEIQKAHQPLRAINSADLAMRRSKRVLRRANEATREATNEKNRANFFARVDMAPASLGRLLTSGTVSARTMHEFTMTEAFLFETRIVLCHALRQRPSRPSRIRRTLSALQLVSSSQTKPPKRQSASSSVSSATLHNDDYFRLPEIDTVTPPAGLLQSSHISLVTLRDPPRITFTSSPDVTIKEEDEEDEEEAPLDPLMLRLSLPTDAISQVCQTNEDNGTISLALQFLAFDSADETLLVMRQLTPEDAALWVRMLKRTVPLVPVSDDDNCLLVNPGFSQAVLGKHI